MTAETADQRVPNRAYRLTPARLTGHLVVLAIGLWTVAAFDAATPTWRLRTGQVKGTDFVHFYTLAQVGARDGGRTFADLQAQRSIQLSVRPESIDDWYPPVYGPQVAVALAPLARLSYGTALVTWLALTTAVYLALIAWLLRAASHLRPYWKSVALAAVAFPPFWQLILHGQLSIVAMTSMVVAWWFLRRGRPLLAGAALGILGYKLSILAPVLAVLAVAGCWPIFGAAAFVTVAQIAIGIMWSGLESMSAYLRILGDTPALAATLAAKPYQMHSWRAFWMLLSPAPRVATVLYFVSSVFTVIAAAMIWRRTSEPSRRMASLILAAVLCAPHLYVYDLVIVAPVWMWLTDWYLSQTDSHRSFGWLLYLGYAAPLVGPVVARFAHVQVSVLCFATVLAFMYRHAQNPSG